MSTALSEILDLPRNDLKAAKKFIEKYAKTEQWSNDVAEILTRLQDDPDEVMKVLETAGL